MLLRVALFVMLAIGIIGVAAVGWMLLQGSGGQVTAAVPSPAQPTKVSVLVAARSLRAGSLLKPEDIAGKDVLDADQPAGASLDTAQNRSSLTGAMVRRTLADGQVLLPQDLVRPGDHGFLAAVLGPNMRAVTVAVDAVSGTAGLIWPGDRVDLILTQTMDNPALAAGKRVAAETVLSDARVIAIDQQIVQGQAPDGTVAQANRTATLEVTAAQAERVLVAGRLGKLSLSVLSADRAGADQAGQQPSAPVGAVGADASGQPATGPVTWAGDVSPALNADGSHSPAPAVHVFSGGSDGKDYHF
jgi:pilus assembly protein CpaB